MVDRPILFSAPMVRALLAGTKTQTRRVYVPKVMWDDEVRRTELNAVVWPIGGLGQQCGFPSPLPRFQCGDRLWVREAWRIETTAYDCFPPREIPAGQPILYGADAEWTLNKSTGRSRPSMFMPRWVSRLTLIVSDVRVERLQDISEADAIAEGMTQETADAVMDVDELGVYASTEILCPHARGRILFQSIWENINGPGSWEANPWVAAYTFEVKRENIDVLEDQKDG